MFFFVHAFLWCAIRVVFFAGVSLVEKSRPLQNDPWNFKKSAAVTQWDRSTAGQFASENGPSQKETRKSSNHPFSGANSSFQGVYLSIHPSTSVLRNLMQSPPLGGSSDILHVQWGCPGF